MTPIALTVYRFRSFHQEQQFVFPRGPGLYFMTGDNRAEPRLQGNGAGKSSLWEALVWCLYGKTARGITAGQAANWDEGKGCRVSFEFEIEDPWMSYVMTRTWSPNTWTLTSGFGDVVDLTKGGLSDFLPLEYESFLHCVLLPQGEPLFLDLKPEPKSSLFSEIMQLDSWLQYSKTAGLAARELDDEIARYRESLASHRGQLDALGIDRVRQHSDEWRREQDRRLTAVVVEIERATETIQSLRATAKGLLVGDVGNWERDLPRAEARATDCDAALRAARLMLTAAERESFNASEIGAHCPLCKQLVRADTHDQLLGFIRVKVEEAKEAVRGAEIAAHKANEEVEWLSRMRSEHSRYVNAMRAVEDAQHRADDLDRKAREIEEEHDPFAEQIAGLETRRTELMARVADLTRTLAQVEERAEITAGWARWFKDIRLEQIGAALTELEVETNSALNAHGLLNWELHFQTDDLRKDGRVSRGFQVFVQSPHNQRPVPWEAWSGGESQRLRVAAQEGLADLIRGRLAVDFLLEVWDEPTQWLSPQGVTDLLDELAARARREQRQIWIVDHRSLGYGGFDGEVCIVKDADGSRVGAMDRIVSTSAADPRIVDPHSSTTREGEQA